MDSAHKCEWKHSLIPCSSETVAKLNAMYEKFEKIAKTLEEFCEKNYGNAEAKLGKDCDIWREDLGPAFRDWWVTEGATGQTWRAYDEHMINAVANGQAKDENF